jgi:hypothetical protein
LTWIHNCFTRLIAISGHDCSNMARTRLHLMSELLDAESVAVYQYQDPEKLLEHINVSLPDAS